MGVIIVHGAYGSPQENWILWLKRGLEKLGCEVIVPLFHGKRLAKNLGAELNVIHNAGHINEAAGYTKFPRLLEDIKPLIKDFIKTPYQRPSL